MTTTTDRNAVSTDRHTAGTDLDPIAAVTDATRRAVAALRAADADPLDAVAWASAHLAAVERTMLPLARRLDDVDANDIAVVRRLGRRLHLELRRLEQVSSGDAHAAGTDGLALRRRLVGRLEEFTAAESALLRALFARLGADATAAVAAADQHSLAVAPTRPHPYAPHRGMLGAVTFRLEALRDRVLDTMDGRHVPVPRPQRAVREPGRWGQYLLGGVPPANR
jgi:hypothetical protein